MKASHHRRPIRFFNFWHIILKWRHFLDWIRPSFRYLGRIVILLFVNPAVTGVIVILQLLAGAILGANVSVIFTEKTFNTFNANYLLYLYQNMNKFTLWTVVIALALTFIRAILEFYKERIDKKSQREDIERLHSLPDSLWVKRYYSDILPDVMKRNNDLVVSGVRGEFDDDIIIQHIEKLLEYTKQLAQEWDSGMVENYSSNLMIYFPSPHDISKYVKKYWSTNHLFFEGNSPEVLPGQISGILLVVSSSNSSNKFYTKVNEDHHPLILPVILSEDGKNSHVSKQSLPGAPEAYKTKSPFYTSDLLKEVETWLNEDYWRYFTDCQAQSIYEYYQEDHSGRSLLCVPVCCEEDIHVSDLLKFKKGEVIGVLNIYSMKRDMLRGNYQDFYEFLRPILSTLANAWGAYEIWTQTDSDIENGIENDTES